jgi:hypothetical protein
VWDAKRKTYTKRLVVFTDVVEEEERLRFFGA